jgi:lysophospholipase L1-like esterase
LRHHRSTVINETAGDRGAGYQPHGSWSLARSASDSSRARGPPSRRGDEFRPCRRDVALGPDVAIIEFAINDAALHRRVSLAESGANLTAIVRCLRSADPDMRLYLMTMSPAIGFRRLLRPRLERYYDLYPRLAARERTGLIDNRPDWAALPSATLAHALPDGSHPTAEFSASITLANVVRTLGRDLRIGEPSEAL